MRNFEAGHEPEFKQESEITIEEDPTVIEDEARHMENIRSAVDTFILMKLHFKKKKTKGKPP